MAATDGTSLRCSLAFRDLGNITLTMLGKDYKDITELDLSNNTIKYPYNITDIVGACM